MSEYNHVVDKDGDVILNKVDNAISRIDDDRRQQILSDFDEFQMYLRKRIDLGMSIGLDEEQLAAIAQRVAGYLSAHEEPRNSEEKLLQELWTVGTKEEKHILAHMLVRLAKSADRSYS